MNPRRYYISFILCVFFFHWKVSRSIILSSLNSRKHDKLELGTFLATIYWDNLNILPKEFLKILWILCQLRILIFIILLNNLTFPQQYLPLLSLILIWLTLSSINPLHMLNINEPYRRSYTETENEYWQCKGEEKRGYGLLYNDTVTSSQYCDSI